MFIYLKEIHTQIGSMIAGVTDDGICLFDFEQRIRLPEIKTRIANFFQAEYILEHKPLHDLLDTQIQEYFKGTRISFDLPLQVAGSDFQQKVWQLLLQIPYGTTATYKKQSQLYGDEKAIRAIASANGANALAILIPCHRVVGTNGSLTGYAGGIHNKKWLLKHEQSHSNVIAQASLF